MSETNYRGIDYSGPGATCNRDNETGIRYGILPANDLPYVWDSFEADYGPATCPKCGEPAKDACEIPEDLDTTEWEHSRGCDDWYCESCRYIFSGDEAYPDEPAGWICTDEEYPGSFVDSSNDVWCVKSPYYTFAQFCSPCAPGACYLENYLEPGTGAKAYCFGPDCFDQSDEYRALPYPVYSVATDELLAWPRNYFDGVLFFDQDYYYGLRATLESDQEYTRGLMATHYKWHCVIPWKPGFYVDNQ